MTYYQSYYRLVGLVPKLEAPIDLPSSIEQIDEAVHCLTQMSKAISDANPERVDQIRRGQVVRGGDTDGAA